jgi:hypothetical protein
MGKANALDTDGTLHSRIGPMLEPSSSRSADDLFSMLDSGVNEIRHWGIAAVEVMANYLASIHDRRVYPETTARKIR